MVAKSELKFIKSLQFKKYRKKHSAFVVEGPTLVRDLLQSEIVPQQVYSTDAEFNQGVGITKITDAELKNMSSLVTPNTVLGIFQIPEHTEIAFKENWILALDGIRDPGNLGTIIRLCDWFGIKDLVCSSDTADCYNPKVLQATMGSIARVRVHYRDDFPQWLSQQSAPIYGASMEGDSIYSLSWPTAGILVMGNEGQGIGQQVRNRLSQTCGIPAYGMGGAESLNVAMATGIILGEIRRPKAIQK